MMDLAGAERDADADLARPPRHDEGEHGVEADDGQQRRQQREPRREERQHALVPQALVQLIVERPHVGDHEVGIDAGHLLPQRRHDLARVAVGAGVNGELAHDVHPLAGHRDERLARHLAADLVVAGVGEHADDLGVGRLVASARHLPSDRHLVRQVLIDERLVDDGVARGSSPSRSR